MFALKLYLNYVHAYTIMLLFFFVLNLLGFNTVIYIKDIAVLFWHSFIIANIDFLLGLTSLNILYIDDFTKYLLVKKN